MNRSPRRAMWLIALVLAIAGMIATPREGAAFVMRWEELGPETTGEPDTPGEGRMQRAPATEFRLVIASSPVSPLFTVSLPRWDTRLLPFNRTRARVGVSQ